MFYHASQQDSLQAKTLVVYTLLTRLRADWGGALILSCGLGPLGQAVALAANVVGATCLSIEPDSALCRAAMRTAACDFYVNTVDEAMRVLKNEIRKRQPLSVALELDTAAALDELLDRGVLPQLFTATHTGPNDTISLSLNLLQPHGMIVLDLDGSLETIPNTISAAVHFESFLTQQNLEPHTMTFETAAALKVFDARLRAAVPPCDPRHRWLLAAPRLFHRDRPHRRVVLLTNEELTGLT